MKNLGIAILIVFGLLASSGASWAADEGMGFYRRDMSLAAQAHDVTSDEIIATARPNAALTIFTEERHNASEGVVRQSTPQTPAFAAPLIQTTNRYLAPGHSASAGEYTALSGDYFNFAPEIAKTQANYAELRSLRINSNPLYTSGGSVSAITRKPPSPIAVGLHAGTTGLGAQIEYIPNAYFSGRLLGDWFNVSHGFSASGISYEGQATWTTVSAFADFHPFKNGWLLSAGVYHGMRKASFTSSQVGNVTFDGMQITPAEIGAVRGKAKLSRTSPFIGLGWDSAQHARRGMTFSAMIGADFGKPKVTLVDAGPYAGAAQLQGWLSREQGVAQGEVDGFKAYPVIQFGIGYRL